MKTERPRPRVALVGLGWIGRHRLQSVVDSALADVVALVEPDPVALAAGCTIAPSALAARDLDEALRLEPDGLVVATPSALHAVHSMRALEQGVAVFCQKPLGRTAAEVLQIVEAARAADRLLGVDLSYRFTTGLTKVRDLIQAGELGRIYSIDLTFHNAY